MEGKHTSSIPSVTAAIFLLSTLSISLVVDGLIDDEISELAKLVRDIENVLPGEMLLGCHVEPYQQYIDKSYLTETGEILQCFDNVTVDACWGRCDSHEIPDFNLPYKISHHPVCTYHGKRARTVMLRHCHPDHPDPVAEVFDATDCKCSICSPEDTNCEHILG